MEAILCLSASGRFSISAIMLLSILNRTISRSDLGFWDWVFFSAVESVNPNQVWKKMVYILGHSNATSHFFKHIHVSFVLEVKNEINKYKLKMTFFYKKKKQTSSSQFSLIIKCWIYVAISRKIWKSTKDVIVLVGHGAVLLVSFRTNSTCEFLKWFESTYLRSLSIASKYETLSLWWWTLSTTSFESYSKSRFSNCRSCMHWRVGNKLLIVLRRLST